MHSVFITQIERYAHPHTTRTYGALRIVHPLFTKFVNFIRDIVRFNEQHNWWFLWMERKEARDVSIFLWADLLLNGQNTSNWKG